VGVSLDIFLKEAREILRFEMMMGQDATGNELFKNILKRLKAG